MQQMEEMTGMVGVERKRVEAVVETLATLRSQGESVAEVAHDARNMVTALGLYCDLLEEPGVLATPFTHYGNELRLVAAASRRLVEKLVSLDGRVDPRLETLPDASWGAKTDSRSDLRRDLQFDARVNLNLQEHVRAENKEDKQNKRHETLGRWDLMPAAPIENLAAELLANHNLLAALAGPAVAVTVDVEKGARPVRLTGEDLTRVLVNLVKNAAEAMPAGGDIHIELRERSGSAGTADAIAVVMEDNGPGLPEKALEEIFASGYTTRAKASETRGTWPASHRGLGLAITRSIVEAAGGRILARNRAGTGARFEIELPVRRAGY